ncbi:OprD family outer membrane porin [Sulfuricurvum sp.]|uniref:OprD family outer membrane porin n=1 Tax=Sulfuricurvum sp. TaxID=2025608 RepID=UPI003C5E06A4
MKKSVALSLSVYAVLSANEMDVAFAAGKTGGNIRTVYVNQNNASAIDTDTTAIGGILKYETAAGKDLKLGIGAYVSQKIGFASGRGDHLNYDLLSVENGSFAYIGEAYMDYTASDVTLRVGRQSIDTPFADTDDIRMVPNSFEAGMAIYSGIEKTTLVGGYIKRWAGYDSGDDISAFKKLDADYETGATGESKGAFVLGMMNESIENLALQGWFYSVDQVADLYYADGTYVIPFSERAELEVSAQYARFDEKADSGIDGNVYGVSARFNAGAVSVGAAYNRGNNGEGKATTNGFGGGPYMTSMEEMTIEGMNDTKAYQLNAQMDMGAAGIEGGTISVLFGDFKSTPSELRVKEVDVIATYALGEATRADISYAMIDDRNNNGSADTGYNRFLARLSYNF